MVSFKFFALQEDQKAIFDFIFKQTDMCVYESYSEYNKELRKFVSFEELLEAYDVGFDKYGKGNSILLQLWSPSVAENPEIKRISLSLELYPEYTFRYRIEGLALVQLYLGGVHESIVTMSYFGHFNEKSAKKWGATENINWDVLKKLSNKIQHHICSRLSVVKASGYPVLPAAYKLAQLGYVLKEEKQSLWECKLS